MPLIPLDLKPGVFKNGTQYGGRGRWADSNLMRWKDSAIRTVGGWARRVGVDSTPIAPLFSDPSDEAPRNIAAWTALDSSRHFVVGTNRALYHISASGAVTDISPDAFVGGPRSSGLITGYGVGAYGRQAYGTPRDGQGLTVAPAVSWSTDFWGQDLVAQFRSSGPIYSWTPNVSTELTPIPNAPQDLQSIVVTDERILLGINATDRLVIWSDSEDREQWTPDATNQAGSIRLAGNGPLINVVKVVNTLLVLGAEDSHVGRYLGPPFIYGFERVSASCGLVAPNAVVVADKFAMWPCGRNMWRFDGAQVQQVQSDVVDFFRRDMNMNERTKIFGFQIRDFNEIWWLYQSNSSPRGEPDSYICYDYSQDHWTKGKLDRTVGADRSASLATPVMVSPDGRVFNHELRGVAITSGPAPFCETAPIELSSGDVQTFVDYVYPDVERAEDATVLFKASDMPQAAERSYGPFSLANPTPVRVRGRQIALRFETRSPNAAIGSVRVNVKGGGKR